MWKWRRHDIVDIISVDISKLPADFIGKSLLFDQIQPRKPLQRQAQSRHNPLLQAVQISIFNDIVQRTDSSLKSLQGQLRMRGYKNNLSLWIKTQELFSQVQTVHF